MAALAPAVAELRRAVRRHIAAAGPVVLVACSGGTDSLALAATAAFVAPRLGRRAGLITVDHALQTGSREQAQRVAEWATAAGLDPVLVETVVVDGAGGPEAAARDARYAALVRAARAHAADTVLLGHTRDDQAETVLLALLRGGGPRGLAGMPERRCVDGVTLVRPLLDVARSVTRAACEALGLEPWHDPHNQDPAYARARARALLGTLVDQLGPAVIGNLATSARLIARDSAALDALAADALTTASAPATGPDGSLDGSLAVSALVDLPAAVRSRVLHAWARALGAPGSALSHRHVDALEALVIDWHGQGPVHLPTGITVTRHSNHLTAACPSEGEGHRLSGSVGQ